MNALIEFGGRLHPLLLHAPIGLFIGLVSLELITLVQRGHKPVPAPKPLVWLTAATAVVSAVSGLLLAREDGYGGDGLELHRWGGIVAAVLSVIMALFRMGSPRHVRIGYHSFLALFGASLVYTGHMGASITHGEDFLFEPFTKSRAGSNPLPDDLFAPVGRILQAKCVSCHGPDKRKGGLALHNLNAILEGGEMGPAVVIGSPQESELLIRIHLPMDDEYHMPPAKKQQLTAEEIATIEAWIGGSPTNAESRGAEPLPEAASASAAPAPAAPRAVPDAAALARLQAARVHVATLDAEHGLLWVDTSSVSPPLEPETARELLRPIAPFIGHLTLAKGPLPTDLPLLLAAMTELQRLDLRQTATTDAEIGALAGHPALTDLVLTQTQVTDAAVEGLAMVPSLKRLYLWGTGVTPDAAAHLRTLLPATTIDLGDTGAATVLESEPDLKLSSDAPPPGQALLASLTPINTTCPVSGSPVDTKYMVVYEGKVIAFCCPNCPKQFWADPQKFLSALASP